MILIPISGISNAPRILKPTISLPLFNRISQVGIVSDSSTVRLGGRVAVPLITTVHTLLETVSRTLQHVCNDGATVVTRCAFVIGDVAFFAEDGAVGCGVGVSSGCAVAAVCCDACEAARDG